ncbi:hypothetical protein [Micromonospora ureilytica]|uniref:hypothetical protein n=1 Tax=Micromonospora ureilytica TaxID=709868 RepID=UPI00403A3743
MPTGLELLLAQKVGTAAAKAAVLGLTRRSFPGRLISRLKRHQIEPKLTFREKWGIRRLVRTPDVWPLLWALSPTSLTDLALRIDEEVVVRRGVAESASTRARLLANAVQAEIMGALDVDDAQAGLSHQIRLVDDSVRSLDSRLSDLGVGVLRDAVPLSVDPDVVLRGPMEALGLAAKHAQAQELSDGDPVGAARLFCEIAERLEVEGYGGLARPVRLQEARLLTKGRQPLLAAAAWMPLVLKDLSDGSTPVCREAASAFEQLGGVPSAPAWLPARAAVITQLDRWFRDLSVLSTSLLTSACAVVEAEDPNAQELFTLAVEAALAAGDRAAVVRVRTVLEAAVAGAEEDIAVRLELVLAEAARDEARWARLLDRAAPASAGISTKHAALVYARRGRYLFWDNKLLEAEAAYRAAVERACRAALWQDAAQWMLARARILSRASVIGDLSDLVRRASAVRASGSGGLLQRGHDPLTAALKHLLAGKLQAALPELRRHLRDSVRVAHLEDEIEAHRRLGTLYEKTEREPAAAVHHYVMAGDAKAAARIAGLAPFFVDCAALAEHPQAQTRAAALQATAAQGDLVPDADVETWITRSLASATGARTGIVGPLPWVQGFAVLAALAERIEEPHLDAVLDAVDPLVPRQANEHTWVDDSLVRIIAGLAVHLPASREVLSGRILALFDASDDLARELLNETAAVEACLDQLREPLRQRAESGKPIAVQLLAIQGDTHPAVVAAVEEQVRTAIESPPNHGAGYVAERVGVALPAYVAGCLPVDRQVDLARDFVRRALESGDSEGNRTQAMRGCEVLAASLPDTVRRELAELVLPASRGDAPLSPFDQLGDRFTHPLGTFQMFNQAGSLRRAAVRAAACLAVDEDVARRVWEAARPLLRTGNRADSLAAAGAAYRLAERGFPPPMRWADLASSGDASLRQAAAALMAVHPEIEAALAQELAKDNHHAVRCEAAVACSALASRDPDLAQSLAAILSNDARFSIRRSVPVSLLIPTEAQGLG